MDTEPIGMLSPLVLGGALFAIGVAGVLLRRHMVVMLLAGQLMLLGVLVTVVGFSRMHGTLSGQAFAIFVLVLCAAEAALGLGLFVKGQRDTS